MLSKISVFGVLGMLVVGVSALPANADTAVVQQTTQDMIIDGNGNAAVQSSEQIQRIRVRGGRPGRATEATGVVQDVYQGGYVVGDDNAVIQENTQISDIEERRGRARGRGRGRQRIEIDQ